MESVKINKVIVDGKIYDVPDDPIMSYKQFCEICLKPSDNLIKVEFELIDNEKLTRLSCYKCIEIIKKQLEG